MASFIFTPLEMDDNQCPFFAFEALPPVSWPELKINCAGLFIRLKDLVELGRSKYCRVEQLLSPYLDYYCESKIKFLTMVHTVKQEKKIFVRSSMG